MPKVGMDFNLQFVPLILDSLSLKGNKGNKGNKMVSPLYKTLLPFDPFKFPTLVTQVAFYNLFNVSTLYTTVLKILKCERRGKV